VQNPSLVPVVENNWPLSGVANETVKTVMEKPRYLSFADYDVSIADEFITNYLIVWFLTNVMNPRVLKASS